MNGFWNVAVSVTVSEVEIEISYQISNPVLELERYNPCFLTPISN